MQKRPAFRQLLFWILLLVFGWLIISRLTEIEQLTATLRMGHWPWVLLAILLQLAAFGVTALLYQVALDTVGVRSRLPRLLRLTFAAVFVNATAPSGGAAGVALFLDDAARAGEPTGKTTAGVLLVMVANLGSFCLILLSGLLTLLALGDLQLYEVVAGLLMFVYVGAIAAMLVLGFFRPRWLHGLLRRVQRLVNHVGGWFRQPAMLDDNWAADNVGEFSGAARAIMAQPGHLARTLAVALAIHGFNLLTLFVLFLAFSTPVSFSILVAGYSMTILFGIISPTPSGIGIVEGLMPVIYASLGLPAGEAAVVSLAFRGLSFWLPLLVGFLLLRHLALFQQEAESADQSRPIWPVAILTGLMGILNIISAVTPALAARVALLDRLAPLVVREGGAVVTAVAGGLLLLLAYGLSLRHHVAWWLTMLLLLISVFSHLVKGLDFGGAAVAVLLMAYLFWGREAFSDRPVAAVNQAG